MKRLKVLMAVAAIALISVIPAYSAGMISKDKAIEIANGQAPNGVLVKAGVRMQSRILVYDVSIADGSNTLHIIKINAENGNIVEKRSEKLHANKTAQLFRAKITPEQAEKTALDGMKDSQIKETKLDVDDGRVYYDIEFFDANGYEYEAAVDAIDGTLIYRKQEDMKRYNPAITKAQAEDAAVKSMKGQVLYTELDEDDKVLFYEVTLISDDLKLYEITINATSGRVVKTEIKD